MSIVGRIKEKIAGGADQVPAPSSAIEARLREAETRLPALEARHGDLAYKAAISEANEKDASEKEAAVALGELRAHRDLVANLHAALGRARDIEAAATAQARASVFAAQVRSVQQHVARRAKLAEKAMSAVQEACEAFRALDETNSKIVAAWPAGVPTPPLASLLHFGALKRALAEEMFRVGHGLANHGGAYPRMFPGAAVHDLRLAGMPDDLTPFDAKMKDDAEFIVGLLTGKLAPPAPVPAPEPAAALASQAEPVTGPTVDARSYVPTRQKMS